MGFAVACAALYLETERIPAPLDGGLFAILFLLGAVGGGYLVGGWTALLLTPGTLVAALGDQAPLFLMFVVTIATPVVAFALGAGVLLRRRSTRPRLGIALAALAAAWTPLPVWALDELRPPVDRHPDQVQRIDERAGSYRGVRLGDTDRAVVRRLGRPVDRKGESAPAGADYYEIGGPTSFGAPGPSSGRDRRDTTLRYRDTSVFVFADGVYGFVTIDPDAETLRGIGIGDSPELVTDRYENSRCYTGNEGTEWARFPLCEAVIWPGRCLYFGGSPIKSVWFVTQTRFGFRREGEPRFEGCGRP